MTHWLASTLIATAIAFADVSGTWKGTLSPEGGDPHTALLELREEGGTITGTAGGENDDQRLPIRNGTAKDGVITFEVETPGGYVLRFVLKEQGDELSGTATRERDRQQERATVRLERKR